MNELFRVLKFAWNKALGKLRVCSGKVSQSMTVTSKAVEFMPGSSSAGDLAG